MTETQLPRYRLEYYDSTDMLPVALDESDDIDELIGWTEEAWNERLGAYTSLVLAAVIGENLFDDTAPVRVWLEEPEADWPEREWPELADAGRLVELLLDDGSTVTGQLEPYAPTPGEETETPLARRDRCWHSVLAALAAGLAMGRFL